MSYDDDEIYDGYSDSFDEEEAVQAVIKSLMPQIKVTEVEAEAELDKVDWDVDAAVANLRKRHAKLKQGSQKKPSAPLNNSNGKLTPLQMLAQRRNQLNQQTTDPHNGSQTNVERSNHSPDTRKSELSGLSRLAQLRTKAVTPDTKTQSASLEKLRQRRIAGTSQSKNHSTSEVTTSTNSVPSSEIARVPKVDSTVRKKSWVPPVDYAIHVSELSCMQAPSGFGSVIGKRNVTSKNMITNSVETSKSASKAFSKPSPDDIVLQAQSKAFAKHDADKLQKTNVNAQPEKKLALTERNKDDLIDKLSTLKLKQTCSFVVIGHVDAGKSTLMGRLLYDTGALDSKEVHKFEKESAKIGKSSFWLAWALDSTEEERTRGVTVDIGEATFETSTTRFTVLDAPGHQDYVPNMIAGVTQADIAVLVVDTATNAFESGFSLSGQTREHVVLARSLGIEKVIVAVNKLDTQGWSQERFEDIEAQLTEFLTKKVGYNREQISYIPTSGITGVNIVKNGSEPACSWYKGPSLVGALEGYAKSMQNRDSLDDPFRFMVSNAYIPAFNKQWVVSGHVLTGCVNVGDRVEVIGIKDTAVVKSVNQEVLVSGENGEFALTFDNLKLEDKALVIRPGSVIVGANAQLGLVTKFKAKVLLFDVPRPILPGTKLSFHLGRVDDMVTVKAIFESLAQKKSSATPPRKLRHLGKGAYARVELELASPTTLAPASVCKQLARFVLRLNGSTIGGGVVESVENQ